jgi:hypothetical protein
MSICENCLTGFASDHNVVENRFTLDDGDSVLTLPEWQSATGQDSNSVSVADVDALFVDSAGGNYHLVSGAAVDVGENLPDVPDDLDGTPRPLGSAWDAGCYEFEYENGDVLFRDGFED